VITGRASRSVNPPVPTVTDTDLAAPGLGTTLVVFLDQRLGPQRQRMSSSRSPCTRHLNGVTAPIDRG
jgi:hypothetical protein